MRESLKNNTKIKTIAFVSAIILWMYVMAVVDPEETRVLEDIPIKITNINELREEELIIYPQEELNTDIYITGKLSNLKNIGKDDINIYGQIDGPIEGKNDVYLRASTSQRVTYEFKNPIMIVNLEKLIQEKRTLDIQIEGASKNNIDELVVEDNIDSIKISGPRTLVNEVQKIVGVLDVDSRKEDFYQTIKLQPVNEKGDIVQGIELDKTTLKVNVSMLQEKVVPIKLNVVNNEEINQDIKSYKLSKSEVTIKGKKSIIDSIEYIDTENISVESIIEGQSKEVKLNIPEGVISDTEEVTVKINEGSKTRELYYKSTEIDIINTTRDDINVQPEELDITVTYSSDIDNIDKSDIKLYIDLLENNNNTNIYNIKYDTKTDLSDISIEPKTIKIK